MASSSLLDFAWLRTVLAYYAKWIFIGPTLPSLQKWKHSRSLVLVPSMNLDVSSQIGLPSGHVYMTFTALPVSSSHLKGSTLNAFFPIHEEHVCRCSTEGGLNNVGIGHHSNLDGKQSKAILLICKQQWSYFALLSFLF